MSALRVAAFGDDSVRAMAQTGLTRAGFAVYGTAGSDSFCEQVPAANCAVIIAHEVRDDHLPDPLQFGHLPPVIVVSSLPSTRALGRLRHAALVLEVLAPEESHRLLVRAVTDAAIGDVIDHIRQTVLASDDLTSRPCLREGLLKALEKPVPTVTAMARAAGCGRQAVEKMWKLAFDSGPTAATFLRGLLLLRAIRLRVRDPRREWAKIAATLGITPDRLRDIARDLVGEAPSELDLAVSPGVVTVRVCVRALSPHFFRR